MTNDILEHVINIKKTVNPLTTVIAQFLISGLRNIRERIKYFEIQNHLFLQAISHSSHATNQHHLKRRPVHRKVATTQTSELVDKAPKTCNSYPDAIFK